MLPHWHEQQALDHLHVLREEARVRGALRAAPSWRSRLARALLGLAVRCEPGVLPPTPVLSAPPRRL